jgi:hypothetical protein
MRGGTSTGDLAWISGLGQRCGRRSLDLIEGATWERWRLDVKKAVGMAVKDEGSEALVAALAGGVKAASRVEDPRPFILPA